jgi:transposase
MGRERREVWRKRVERWARSGLTAEEFSRETGVRVGTLRYWRWRFGAEARASREAQERPRFVEVVVPVGGAKPAGGDAGFEVVLPGGASVRVPSGFDVEALRRLVQVLEDR